MNPFGTPSKCPRCDKTVYAAEQIIGPGRQVYHKFCLKCASCNKRLDSYSLVEHDNQPYCKGCHLREFGTQDLRHQNLARTSPPASPSSGGTKSPSSPPSIDAVTGRFTAGTLRRVSYNPPLTPPRTISPVTENQETEPEPHSDPVDTAPESTPMVTDELEQVENMLAEEAEPIQALGSDTSAPPPLPARSTPSAAPALPPRTLPLKNSYNFEYRSSKPNTPTSRFPAPLSPSAIKRGSTGFAALRAGPPSPTRRAGFGADGVEIGDSALASSATGDGTPTRPFPSTPAGTMRSSASTPVRPLSQTPTGGMRPMMTGGGASPIRPMFTGGGAGSPNVFGGRVECPRCAKAVYHAEQVTGPGGRKYHKLCLRCVNCNSSLDSGKLTEKDGEPMCRNCYSKLHGPQGAGYALMGRAG
ncbi:hypothetical protein FRC09_001219 [Ceratobasidium sp. 395]|nr:hypothetical protein FRC09_001219 [Ceratobasidium sp. 395]